MKSEAELAELLDHMRRFCGLSLRDLARRSGGFSHHTFGAVLRGDRPVTTDILVAVLHACRVDPGAAQRWLAALGSVRPVEERRVQTYISSVEAARRTRIAGRPAQGPRQDRWRNGLTPVNSTQAAPSRATPSARAS
ncbi:helix-turn-helix domain-containing protein [Streptomyces rugosispiralis]|uniref:helix-turn-helix domain-containing protein n=1 Tax=Streptomyces rugosispiralis TaxID=2967341 RepID=UPI003704C4A6